MITLIRRNLRSGLYYGIKNNHFVFIALNNKSKKPLSAFVFNVIFEYLSGFVYDSLTSTIQGRVLIYENHNVECYNRLHMFL